MSTSPLMLRIVSSYMLVRGGLGLVLPLLRLRQRPEFQAMSAAYRAGSHTRELVFSVAYIIAGVGLFWHHDWGRIVAFGLLLIVTLPEASDFAWGYSSAPPTTRVRLFSLVTAVAWNGMWFYLVYRATL